MRAAPESGARQNYNLGDVIPRRRNGLHIPRREGYGAVGIRWVVKRRWKSRWKAIGGRGTEGCEGGRTAATKVGEIYQQLVPH